MEADELFNREIKSVHGMLSDGKIDEVRKLRQTKIFSSLLVNSGSELINSISSFLNDKGVYKCPDIVTCYEEILRIIVEEIDPQNSFITLLEQLDEESCCLEKFLLLLTPLKLSLQKLSTARGYWLEWALSTIKCYLDSLPAPEDHQIEFDEKKMLIDDRYIDSILLCTKTILLFYDAFIENTISPREKDALIVFGFQLLTEPVMYVYLEKFNELESICRDVIAKIDRLDPRIHYLLDYLDDRNMSNVEKHDSSPRMEDECESTYPSVWDRMLPLSLAVYYSIVITDEPFLNYFPLVYDKLYLFHKLFFLGVALLQHTHNAVTRKGLLLCRHLLLSIEDCRIPHFYLELKVHREFVKIVSYVSIYSYIFENRKVAVELLQLYVRKFDIQGTYLLFLNITSATNNADVDSELITMFRNDMYASFQKNELKFYQKGKRLIDLLKVFCDLGESSDTDMMKYKNKIISMLHLFALILRRDTENITTIHDHVDYFEKHYFSVVQVAIRKSRKTFKLEANALMNDRPHPKSGENFNVVVDGKSLPRLRKQEKINATRNALTALTMIENALELVYEYANRRSMMCA